jgi:succinyl-diaminopimelate desuccinylase
MPDSTLLLAQRLIACASVTPEEGGCLSLLTQELAPLGFVCERMDSGPSGFFVRNLWALRQGIDGPSGPTVVFAGHVDVVPPGPLEQWSSPPFEPCVREGKLYGRGASDMKTPLAAMIVAAQAYVAASPDTRLNIGFLLTSDEEGPAVDGTVAVCRVLQARGQRLDYCVIGEPTAETQTGDTIKNGRRGSLTGRLTVKGVQGHIAYPHLARNPIHMVAPALAELAGIEWDKGNDYFPPTGWQISNIHGGTGAGNVIPGSVVIDFNFRFSTASTPETLQQRLEAVLRSHQLDYSLEWTLGGKPFLTPAGVLVDAARHAIAEMTGLQTQLSTSGGTSDGRFIAPICPQVIELGPPNASIHKVDEHIALADMAPLSAIYRRILELLENCPER